MESSLRERKVTYRSVEKAGQMSLDGIVLHPSSTILFCDQFHAKAYWLSPMKTRNKKEKTMKPRLTQLWTRERMQEKLLYRRKRNSSLDTDEIIVLKTLDQNLRSLHRDDPEEVNKMTKDDSSLFGHPKKKSNTNKEDKMSITGMIRDILSSTTTISPELKRERNTEDTRETYTCPSCVTAKRVGERTSQLISPTTDTVLYGSRATSQYQGRREECNNFVRWSRRVFNEEGSKAWKKSNRSSLRNRVSVENWQFSTDGSRDSRWGKWDFRFLCLRVVASSGKNCIPGLDFGDDLVSCRVTVPFRNPHKARWSLPKKEYKKYSKKKKNRRRKI